MVALSRCVLSSPLLLQARLTATSSRLSSMEGHPVPLLPHRLSLSPPQGLPRTRRDLLLRPLLAVVVGPPPHVRARPQARQALPHDRRREQGARARRRAERGALEAGEGGGAPGGEEGLEPDATSPLPQAAFAPLSCHRLDDTRVALFARLPLPLLPPPLALSHLR